MVNSQQPPPSAQFVQLFTKHQCALNAFVSSMVPTRADVEDIMQETSLTLWGKWDKYDASRDFFRWACGFAHIQVLRHRRKVATDKLWFNEEVIDLLSTRMLEKTELFDLRRDALDRCLEKLSDVERQLVELRYQDGMKVEKVSESLGKSSRSIHRIMARIRRLLCHCITTSIKHSLWSNS